MKLAKSAVLLAACPLAARSAAGAAAATPLGCAWCGKPKPAGRRTWCSGRCATRFWNNHWWPRARQAAKRRDKRTCRRCGAAPRALEINHKIPCLGAHGKPSCAHHLDNLETLCAPCHRVHTRAMLSSRS